MKRSVSVSDPKQKQQWAGKGRCKGEGNSWYPVRRQQHWVGSWAPSSVALWQLGCRAGKLPPSFPWDWCPLGVYLPTLHLGQVWRHCRAEPLPAEAAPLCVLFPIPISNTCPPQALELHKGKHIRVWGLRVALCLSTQEITPCIGRLQWG